MLATGLVGGEEQVGGGGEKVVENLVIARGAGLDDLAREDVGIDDGQIVGRFAENIGNGRLAGGNGAG